MSADPTEASSPMLYTNVSFGSASTFPSGVQSSGSPILLAHRAMKSSNDESCGCLPKKHVTHIACPCNVRLTEEAQAVFLQQYPEFEPTKHVCALRQTEFSRLNAAGDVYLDYTGGGIAAESQVRKHTELVLSRAFGNPHSSNPTSHASTLLVEEARRDILDFFHADPAEYDCVFTLNASGALRLIGEGYPFTAGSHYLLLSDNHNSVNGIREFARTKGAAVNYVRVSYPNLRVNEDELMEMLEKLGDRDKPKLKPGTMGATTTAASGSENMPQRLNENTR